MTDNERATYEWYRERGYPAALALTITRNKANQPEIEWKELWSYPVLASATVERDGFTVKLRIMQEEGVIRVEFTDDKPDDMPNLYANPKEWYDETDEYGTRARRHDYYGWVEPEEWMSWEQVLTNAQANGTSKQVAFETAVEEVHKWIEWVTSEDYMEVFIVAEAYRNGIELGSDSLGGIEIGSPWSKNDMLDEAMGVLRDYDLIGNAIAEAKKNLKELAESTKETT